MGLIQLFLLHELHGIHTKHHSEVYGGDIMGAGLYKKGKKKNLMKQKVKLPMYKVPKSFKKKSKLI